MWAHMDLPVAAAGNIPVHLAHNSPCFAVGFACMLRFAAAAARRNPAAAEHSHSRHPVEPDSAEAESDSARAERIAECRKVSRNIGRPADCRIGPNIWRLFARPKGNHPRLQRRAEVRGL